MPEQARLLELLTADHRNLTVTGDPYQSIYSFRGAELRNINEFPERFRGVDGQPARRVVLTTSFRVPKEILDGAVRVVSGGNLPGEAGPVEPAKHSGRVEAQYSTRLAVRPIGASESSGSSSTTIPSANRFLVRSSRHLLPDFRVR